MPGDYQENLKAELPKGEHRAEWVEPATGKVVAAGTIKSDGGRQKLANPRFAGDVALRIRRTGFE